MHGYSRLGLPRASPPSSPRFRHGGRRKTSGRGASSTKQQQQQSVVERAVFFVISVVFRRRGMLLFAPLLYISFMLLYMGSVSFDVASLKSVVSIGKASPPGSVYRSPQVFEILWPYMEAESMLSTVWNSKVHKVWKPCIPKDMAKAELPKSNGLFIIEANGGLNQQRLSTVAEPATHLRGDQISNIARTLEICDAVAVAVAGLLNATLLIPIFHLNSVWRDSSHFGNIFDEDFFIESLRNHINVVRELPEDILQRFDNNISNIVNLRVKGWSSSTHYVRKVLPKLQEMGAVRIAPFSNRLAHAVPSDVQSLRGLANFEALRFSNSIRLLADKMVDRMIKSSGGKYVSVHLRFEEDMVAFSCCEYDGGEEEKHEMDIARERSWRGKFRRRGRVIRPGANRVDGKCPLTPLEVGMMLRGMGFDNTTSVYIAAGKIYKAEKYMAPLKQMFPRLQMKDTLATSEELAPYKGHLSRLAALDYTICLHSEVFVTTQGGNFPHFLMGHRRYLYGGHSKTIKPDKRKLTLLFDNPSIRWEDFKRQMQDMLRHSDQKGVEVRKPSASLYTFPMPDCMCKEGEVIDERSNTTLT